MGAKSKIEWTSATWNVVRGCSRISPGCGGGTPGGGGGCYAERQAIRLSGPGQAYEGLVKSTPDGPRWTGKVRLVEELLPVPAKWRRPQRIFVNSMSDLFHEALTDEQIRVVYEAMQRAPQHQFQILTKRAQRMRAWAAKYPQLAALPHLWHGISIENRKTLEDRLPNLLATDVAVRWVSFEPLLESLGQIPASWLTGLKWAVIGGESGPGARGCDLEWIRELVRSLSAAKVRTFVKQLGASPYEQRPAEGAPTGLEAALNGLGGEHPQRKWFADWTLVHHGEESTWYRYHRGTNRKGGDPAEWPEDLRIREYPDDSKSRAA